MKEETQVEAPADPHDAGQTSISPTQRRACRLLIGWTFFTAIVRDGLGPLVSVYLVATRGWTPGQAGFVWMLREFAMMGGQVLMGDLMDKSTAKLRWLMLFTAISSITSTSIAWTDNFWILCVRGLLGGFAAASIGPGTAALTLGVVGPEHFDREMPRIERGNHAGSLFAAAGCAFVSYFVYPDFRWIFVSIGICSGFGIVCLFLFPLDVLSDRLARGKSSNSVSRSNSKSSVSSVAEYRTVFREPNFVAFCCSCFLFHFGNASVLPLLGQQMAITSGREGLIWAASLIIVAQVTSVLATHVLKLSKYIGYKGVLAICYLHLPIRCFAIVAISRWFSGNFVALLATQLLDGIGAGTFGVALLSVTRALTRGTGRFNVSFGVASTVFQCGAALSNLVGGVLADVNYDLAFAILGAFGVLAFLAIAFAQLSERSTISGPDKEDDEDTVQADVTRV